MSDQDILEIAGRRRHDLSGNFCWCEPRIMQTCPECLEPGDEEGKVVGRKKPRFAKAKRDCWKCQGTGMVTPYDPDLPKITVHRGPVRFAE